MSLLAKETETFKAGNSTRCKWFAGFETGGEGGIRFASCPIQPATYRLHVPEIAEFATAARVPCTISHDGALGAALHPGVLTKCQFSLAVLLSVPHGVAIGSYVEFSVALLIRATD